MTGDENERLDALIEASRPPMLALVAAAVLALEGLILILVGVQNLVFLRPQGLLELVPLIQLGLGALAIVTAHGFGRAQLTATWGAVAVSAAAFLASGLWLLLSLLAILISALSFLAVGVGTAAFTLVLIALPGCRSAARASRQLEELSLGDSETAAELQESLRAARRRVTVTLAILAALGVVAIATVVAVQSLSPGLPTRVVVLRRGGIEAAFDERLADAFRRQLADLGLDAVPGGPVAGEDWVAEAREAARDAEAAQAILLELAATREREGLRPSDSLFALSLRAWVVQASGDAAAEQPPSRSMEFAAESPTPVPAAERVQRAWLAGLVPWVVDQVFQSPSFRPVLNGDVALDEVEAATKLRQLEPEVTRRRERERSFESFCEAERERLRATNEAAEGGAQCAGDPCGQYTLLGVDDAGRAIVQDISRSPLIPLPLTRQSRWVEPPERLVALPLSAGGQERPLLRAAHFFGFGRLSGDGRVAFATPFGEGGALAVSSIVLATGDHRPALVLEGDRVVRIAPHPDGAGVTVRLRSGSWVDVADGQRRDLPEAYGWLEWVGRGGDALLAGQLETGELLLRRTPTSPEEARLSLDGRVTSATALDEGRLELVLAGAAGCSLVEVLLPSGELRSRHELPLCLEEPRRLPDGRYLGLGAGRDEGGVVVTLVDPETSEVTALTSGEFTEEQVFATVDGRHAVFNRRLAEWPPELDLGVYRRVVCWVNVPERRPDGQPSGT